MLARDMKLITSLLLTVTLVACQSAKVAPASSVHEGALVHHVTLTLRDAPPAEVAAMLAACWSLRDIPGVLELEAGLPAKELATEERPQDYSVALRVVFVDQAAHDAYIVHPKHQALLERFGPQLAGAQVSDWWIRR